MAYKTHLRVASVSVNGNVRANNEDNYYIDGKHLSEQRIEYPVATNTYKSRTHVIAVFDGMGGEKKGDVASYLAAKSFRAFHHQIESKLESQDDIKRMFDGFIKVLNDKMCFEADKLGVGRMGTTMAAVVIQNGIAQVFNLGDSRVYLYRRKMLQRITNDHNEAAMMIKLGLLTPESARNHPSKYRLTQHLGIKNDDAMVESETYAAITLRSGDVIVLCSDGLNDELTDAEIGLILEKNEGAEKATTEMIEAVLKREAKDNITIVNVQVEKITSFLGFKI